MLAYSYTWAIISFFVLNYIYSPQFYRISQHVVSRLNTSRCPRFLSIFLAESSALRCLWHWKNTTMKATDKDGAVLVCAWTSTKLKLYTNFKTTPSVDLRPIAQEPTVCVLRCPWPHFLLPSPFHRHQPYCPLFTQPYHLLPNSSVWNFPTKLISWYHNRVSPPPLLTFIASHIHDSNHVLLLLICSPSLRAHLKCFPLDFSNLYTVIPYN